MAAKSDAAHLKDAALKTKVHVKNLVLLVDSDLSFYEHVKGIIKSDKFIHALKQPSGRSFKIQPQKFCPELKGQPKSPHWSPVNH